MPYARYTVGNGNGGKVTATTESIIADGSHRIGNDCIFTTCYQSIGFCLNDGITVVSRIILSIGFIHCNGFRVLDSAEGTFTDSCYAVGNVDGCQIIGTIESPIADGGHRVGNGDGGEAVAPRESIITDSRYAVGDVDRCQITAFIKSITADGGHRVGNDCIFTTSYQSFRGGFNDRIAVVTRVIRFITTLYCNTCKPCTT